MPTKDTNTTKDESNITLREKRMLDETTLRRPYVRYLIMEREKVIVKKRRITKNCHIQSVVRTKGRSLRRQWLTSKRARDSNYALDLPRVHLQIKGLDWVHVPNVSAFLSDVGTIFKTQKNIQMVFKELGPFLREIPSEWDQTIIPAYFLINSIGSLNGLIEVGRRRRSILD